MKKVNYIKLKTFEEYCNEKTQKDFKLKISSSPEKMFKKHKKLMEMLKDA